MLVCVIDLLSIFMLRSVSWFVCLGRLKMMKFVLSIWRDNLFTLNYSDNLVSDEFISGIRLLIELPVYKQLVSSAKSSIW